MTTEQSVYGEYDEYLARNGQGANGESPPVVGRRVHLTKASEIVMRRVRWLYTSYIPLGEVSLVGGREGVGKSTVCYQLLADVTRGRLAGECQGAPRAVLVAATEDSWAHTICPRLVAAEADLDKVYRVEVATADDVLTGLVLPVDLAELKAAVIESDAAVVLFDPLLSRLDKRLDSHKDAEVRRALEPLAKLAHDCEIAVLGLIHVNKSGSSDLLASLMASVAFVAVARAVLFCMKDPEDETGKRRVFGQAKCNLGPDDPPVRVFTIATVTVEKDPVDGLPITAGQVVWQGESSKTLRELGILGTHGPTSKDTGAEGDAKRWLEKYLVECGGRAPSRQCKADAKEYDHAEATLKRAMSELAGLIEVEEATAAERAALPGRSTRATFWCLHDRDEPGAPGRSAHCAQRRKAETLTQGEQTGLFDTPEG